MFENYLKLPALLLNKTLVTVFFPLASFRDLSL